MRTLLIATASVDEPVTVPEVRMHLRNPERIDNNAEIIWFIQSAKRMVEHKLGRKLMAQTWEGYLDSFPENDIEFPYSPLSSVTSIKYQDSASVLQTVPTTDYVVDTTTDVSRVYLAYGKTWPSGILALQNAVVIRFVIGYPDADAIPPTIKHYMKLLIGEFYINRELTTEREVFLTPWAERLLDADRVLSVV